jgi:nucleotide-binding universal stress UspA family protein
MTIADASPTVAAAAAAALRMRVRDLLEDEYLRLSCLDRRPVSAMSGATPEDGVDPDAVAQELTVLDARIARLHDHLAAFAADPSGPARGRVLLLDLGDGPRLMLLSPIGLIDEQVIAEDSPLGAALRDAVPGQVVTYPLPHGTGRAQVLAVEPPPAPRAARAGESAETGMFGLVPAEVLVGFDGTPSSRSAVAWAAREAALRARPLRVLHARDDGASSDPIEAATGVLAEGILLAADSLQHHRIRASAISGDAASRLAERAGSADLVVVGRGGDTPTGLGPVANEVLETAARATVVVPPGPVARRFGRVVVGVRHSAETPDALAVAFAEANRRESDLVVTVIWDDEPGAARVVDGLEPAFHEADVQDVATLERLRAAVAGAGRAFPTVPVTIDVRTGRFSEVLVELSHTADLIVLGRGHGTSAGRSDLQVASSADCPVIVVRESGSEGGS